MRRRPLSRAPSKIDPSIDRARAARLRGSSAEDAVATDLSARGISVLGRNVRVGRDELDVLAREGTTLVIVEVRTRSATKTFYGGGAFASVGPRKKACLLRAAAALLAGPYADDETVERLRIDVAVVTWDAGVPVIAYARGAVTA